MKAQTVLFCALLLSGCNDRVKFYGYEFELICPNATWPSAWDYDRSGKVKLMRPALFLTIKIPYGGGIWKDGDFVPFPNQTVDDCRVWKATIRNGEN